MNRRLAISASFPFAIFMLFSGTALAAPANQSHEYTYGNDVVLITGNQVYVGFGNQLYPVTWVVDNVNGSPVTKESVSHLKLIRIDNTRQNSVVLIQNNSYVKLTEIFSFLNDEIDSSLAITNINHSSGTYAVVFSMDFSNIPTYELGGYSPATVHSYLSSFTGSNDYLIPSSDYSMGTQGVHVSWQNELSLFKNGILSVSSSNGRLILPFGPLCLVHNQTYSVDPTITPQSIAPCPSCGGGGGTSYSTPTVSDSVTSNETLNGVNYGLEGLPITLHADVTSLGGSSSATLMFDVNTGGYYFDIYSCPIYGTGTYSYTWYPPSYESTGYFDYEAYVENPDYTGHGGAVGLGIFQAAPSSLNVSVYDSSGSLVATYTMSAVMDTTTFEKVYSIPSSQTGQATQTLCFGTAAGWYTSQMVGVWCLKQTVGQTTAPGYTQSGGPLKWGYVQPAYQAGSNQQLMDDLSTYIVGILNSVSYGLIPNPSWFVQAQTAGDVYSTSNQSYDQSGTVGGVCLAVWYCPIYATNGSADHLFGYYTYQDTFYNNPSTYLDLYTYNDYIQFEMGSIDCPTFLTSTGGLTTGVYVPPMS